MAYIRIKNGITGEPPTSLLKGEPAYSINDNKTYIGNGSSVVRLDAGSYTAECATAAGTAEKVATCPGIILIKGVEVTVKFTADNTVAPASLRLNINNTGAKLILYRGSSLPSASVLSANRVYKFYYNGSSWELIGDLDTDTTVGAALTTHTSNTDNPHAVTTSQIGAVDLTTNQTIGGVKTFTDNVTASSDLTVGGDVNVSATSAYLYDGVQALKLAKGTDTFYANTFVGYNAGNSSAYRQTALGSFAGQSNTGSYQTALGWAAGYSNTGAYQTALGYNAGYSNSGDRVIGIGYEATRGNTATADDVVAIGYQAGKDNTIANLFILKQTNINAVPLIQGNFSSGNVSIGSTDTSTYKLYVSGTGHYTSNLSVGGTLGVTGNTTLSGTLGVIGSTTLAGGVGITSGALTITGKSTQKTPYIDFFHYNGTGGYSRIIEEVTKELSIYGGADADGKIKLKSDTYAEKAFYLGSAKFTYEVVEGVGFIKLAHSDGTTPMHLVTTGGQTMCSTGVPASGDSGGSGTLVYLNGSSVASETAYIYTPTTAGSSNNILKSNGSGEPSWVDITSLIPWGGSGTSTMVSRSDHNHTGVYATASHGHATLLYTKLLYTDSYSDTHNVLGYSGTSEYDITLGNDTYKTIINGSPIVLEPFTSYTGLVKCTNGTLSVDTNTYSLSSHTHDYLPLAGGSISGNLVVGHATDLNAVRLQTGVMNTDPALGALVASGVFSIVAQETNSFGLHTWVRNTGDTYLQSGRGDANTAAYNIVLNALGGKVGVGMVPTTSFEVAGVVQASADYFTKAEYGGFGWKNSSNTITNYLYLDDDDSYIHFNLGEGLKINNDVIFSDGSLQGAVLSNYGVCSTASSTAAKTVTISGFRLATGVSVYIKFSNAITTGSSTTLNINSTGAKNVTLPAAMYPGLLNNVYAGDVLNLVYDGTTYRVVWFAQYGS